LGLAPEQISKRVTKYVRFLRLQKLVDRAPHHLSYGEKKRVAIAGVLAMEPEVLLLDEPTANLDFNSATDLINIIKNLRKTIVIATHDVNVAVQLATQVYILNSELIARGSVREIFNNPSVLERANLTVPEVTKLYIKMTEYGYKCDKLPLTVSEASQAFKQLLEAIAQ
jgi:cobalt/nickel transport system ATP-binding protein